MIGSEDLKESLKTVIAVSDFIKTSLGPKSGDKLIVDEKGEIHVTNDGYTILSYLSKRSPSSSTLSNNDDFFNELFDKRLDNNNSNNDNNNKTTTTTTFSSKSSLDRIKYQSIIELLIDCCKSQERSFGDGTTSVIVLTGALCENALKLVFEKGIHPHIVVKGYQQSLYKALNHLELYSLDVDLNNNNSSNNNNNSNTIATLKKVAESCLSSKSVSFYKDTLTTICINAIKSVCKETIVSSLPSILFNQQQTTTSTTSSTINEEKKLNINLKNIKLIPILGESIESTKLIYGIMVSNKFFSHENMVKSITRARVLVLSEALEIPKPKSNFDININSIQEYNKLFDIKNQYFKQLKEKLVSIDPTFIVCQWGIDQEINEFLFNKGINAVSWIQGDDLEYISLVSGASIVYDIINTPLEDIVLGAADNVREIVPVNDSNIRYLEISNNHGPSPIVSIVVRGGSQEMNEETIACIRDCLYVVKGCLMNPKVVPSGGTSELYLYNLFNNNNNNNNNNNQDQNQFKINYCMNSWASSLLSIPITLLENSGVDSYNLLKQLIDTHYNQNPSYSGINIDYQSQYFNDDDDPIKQHDEIPPQILTDMRSVSWDLLELKKSILKLSTETCILRNSSMI